MRGEGWESREGGGYIPPENESGEAQPKYPTWRERYTKWSESRKNEAAALSIKTIKELNKELNEKRWYRFLKVLWLFFYLILLILSAIKTKSDSLWLLTVFTFAYLGAAIALKRVVYYAADYITTGKIYLKEKWYSLLLITLCGVPSIVLMIAFLHDVVWGKSWR